VRGFRALQVDHSIEGFDGPSDDWIIDRRQGLPRSNAMNVAIGIVMLCIVGMMVF
jgi:hypothetical protein